MRIRRLHRPLRLAALAAPLLVACGTNYVGERLPDPDAGAPADAGPSDGADAGEDPNAYPPGPYGGNVGDTIENFTFNGYVNEHPSEGAVEASGYVEGFTLQDVRELEQYDYLLVNVAAEWCSGCRIEAQTIPGLYEPWANRGGYIMSVITQDNSGRTASKRNLDRWINTYPINYTMLHDPQDFIYDRIGPESLPLNMIIDLRTMKILHRVIGEDFGVFDTFESLLSGE